MLSSVVFVVVVVCVHIIREVGSARGETRRRIPSRQLCSADFVIRLAGGGRHHKHTEGNNQEDDYGGGRLIVSIKQN